MKRKYNIGDSYTSKEGVEYTILDYNNKRWVLECKACKEKDPELWYKGSINPLTQSMNEGIVTCGCSVDKKIKWSTEQYKIKVNRVADENGYEVINIPEGKLTTRTRVTLYNPETDNTWDVSINNFLYTKNLDPILNGRIPDKDIILKLKNEGKVPDYVHLERIPSGDLPDSLGQNKYSYWKYSCPVCEKDKFSIAGVSDGSFNVAYTSLTRGFKPCRCGKGYRYTQEEKLFLVEESCKEHELTLLSFEEDVITYTCKYGHVNTKKWNSLTTFNLVCRTCAYEEPRHNGYYKKRANDEDFLYIIGFEDDTTIIKIGRSFNIKDRLVSLRRESRGMSPTILKIFTGCHKDIYEVEQYLLTETRPYKIDVGWTHEVRSVCQKERVYCLLNELDNIEEIEV